jgi:aminoglycoside 6'-N-acetyltransferase I
MSIKAAIKDHFAQGPLSNHWSYFHESFGYGAPKSLYYDKQLLIRKFTFEDMDKCAALYKEVFSDDPWYDKWVSQDQVREYLNELIQNPVFEGFVALDDSEIVAVCLGHIKSWWTGKEFVVDEFFVHNEKQGNGIGTTFMDFICNYLLENEYVRLTLLTNKEIPAEDFYLKNGFLNNQKRILMTKNLFS